MHVLAILLIFLTHRCVEGICLQNNLARQLSAGCPEASSFCASILAKKIVPKSRRQDVTEYYTTYLTTTRTITKSKTTLYLGFPSTTVTDTLTATTAPTTITRSGCRPTIACGAAIFTASFGPLREACSCFLQSTSTRTFRETDLYSYPTTYKTTVTSFNPQIPTTTYKVYTVVTTRVARATIRVCDTVPPPARECKNKGQQLAKWSLAGGKKYQNWNPTKYKSIVPRYNYSGNEYIYFYKNSAEDALEGYDLCYGQYINARGYIYAPQTGYFNLTLAAVKNKVYLWVGESAYKGYNGANAFLHASNKLHGGGPSRLVHWKAGNYYPFRTAWLCGGNPYDFYFHIKRPDGLILWGQYSPNSDDVISYNPFDDSYYYSADYGTYPKYYENYYINGRIFSDYQVQFGCGKDAKLAPNFPDWGHEK